MSNEEFCGVGDPKKGVVLTAPEVVDKKAAIQQIRANILSNKTNKTPLTSLKQIYEKHSDNYIVGDDSNFFPVYVFDKNKKIVELYTKTVNDEGVITHYNPNS